MESNLYSKLFCVLAFILKIATAQYVGSMPSGQYSGAVAGNVPYQPQPQSGTYQQPQPQPQGGVPHGVQPGYFVPLMHDYNVQPYTGFNNTATCNFDKKCFQYSEGCTMINCKPFNRTSPIDCEGCLNLCLTQQNTAGPYCCKAAVYDVQYRICDLFSANIGGDLRNLAKRPGHIYFQPTGLCQASTPAPPAVAICPSGQTEKLIAIKDYQLPGVTGQTIPGVDSAGCARACQSNKGADGSAFSCKSAQFNGNQCTLSTALPLAEGSLQKSPGSTYYQKFCFPSALVAGCADIFEEDPQMILIGQSRQVADSGSVADCWQQCLDAQAKFGFACASAMYFGNVTTQNCILNSETKNTHPDVFTSTDQEKVFYLETGCAGAGGATGGAATAAPGGGGGAVTPAPAPAVAGTDTVAPAPVSAAVMRFKDQSPLVNDTAGQWGNWSTCVVAMQLQFRFRNCLQPDAKKCEKEQRPCVATESGVTPEPTIWGRTSNNAAPEKKSIADSTTDSNAIRKDAPAPWS